MYQAKRSCNARWSALFIVSFIFSVRCCYTHRCYSPVNHTMANASSHSRPGSTTPEKSPICHSSTLENGIGSTTMTSSRFRGLLKDLGGPFLDIETTPVTTVRSRQMLVAANPDKPYLPGQPRMRLRTASAAVAAATASLAPPSPTTAKQPEEDELLPYLRENHISKELDAMLPYMKYIFVRNPFP